MLPFVILLVVCAIFDMSVHAAEITPHIESVISFYDGSKTIEIPAFMSSWTPKLSESLKGDVISAYPLDGCSPITSTNSTGNIIVIDQGGCSFAEKMGNLSSLQPSAVIVVGKKDVSSWIVMGPATISNPVPAFMILRDHEPKLRPAIGQHNVTIGPYQRAAFDLSGLFLFSMAMAIMIVSCYWSSEKERQVANGQVVEEDPDLPEEEIASISTSGAIIFILVASVTLLALYFVIDWLIYALLGLFTISGVSSLVVVLAKPVRFCLPKLDFQTTIPGIGSINMLYTALLAMCVPLGIVWLAYRKSHWAFILQDVMGAAILIMIQRATRLPNSKVATVLLISSFFYDIFWVFLSPFIFRSSVMVAVATGGSSGEIMPMLLTFPRLNDIFGGMALIGFGDIALPGLYIAYVFRFDAVKRTHYSTLALIGYAVGLCLTEISMVVTRMAQPALLFLVPCTLGIVSLVAWWNCRLSSMWKGPNQETVDYQPLQA